MLPGTYVLSWNLRPHWPGRKPDQPPSPSSRDIYSLPQMAKCTVRPAGGNHHFPGGILGSLLDQLDVENSGKAGKRNPLFQDEGS